VKKIGANFKIRAFQGGKRCCKSTFIAAFKELFSIFVPFVFDLPMLPAPARRKRICRVVKTAINTQTFSQIIIQKKDDFEHRRNQKIAFV
jgi:hypothetical protein